MSLSSILKIFVIPDLERKHGFKNACIIITYLDYDVYTYIFYIICLFYVICLFYNIYLFYIIHLFFITY